MSYILDALRKADAQRSSNPARGIHAQPAIAVAGGATGGRRREPWILVTGGALIVITVLGVWFGAGPAVTPPAAPAPTPATVVRVEPAPATPPATVTPATAVLPPAPEAAVAVAPKAAVVPVPPAVSPPPTAERIYSLAELPADVQQALPKFSVNGGVYSENVAQRMLVVNGQVFNEGSEIASGVVLEQVRPRVALLKFRGLRISQPY